MKKNIKSLFLYLCCLLTIGFSNPTLAQGKVLGVQPVNIPNWWSDSFLDITEDAEEAGDVNKHLIVFFHLDGCPYCAKMTAEHFSKSPFIDYLKENFNVVDINVKGDREVVLPDSTELSEKSLAEQLDVFYTPVMLFLNAEAKTVLRVDGYRDFEQFNQILKYVHEKHYSAMSLKDYYAQNRAKKLAFNIEDYALKNHPNFSEVTDLRTIKDKLVLIIAEDKTCTDCNKFHEQHLKNILTNKLLNNFVVVRMNALSQQLLIDFEGNKTTPVEFINHYDLYYRPGLLIFKEGVLQAKRNSWSVLHHFHTFLSYYASGAYKTMSRRGFSQQRNAELLSSGQNIDYNF